MTSLVKPLLLEKKASINLLIKVYQSAAMAKTEFERRRKLEMKTKSGFFETDDSNGNLNVGNELFQKLQKIKNCLSDA